MLKFTSVSDSDRAITDIIRIGITLDLIIIIGRTTHMAGIVIIVIIIVIRIITASSLTGIATPGWIEPNLSQPEFFEMEPV